MAASWAGPAFWPGPIGLPATLLYFFLNLIFPFSILNHKMIWLAIKMHKFE
jgi:hypothetical protein